MARRFFKLREQPMLDEAAGLGLFAGDKRKASARQYRMLLIIGVGMTVAGTLCLFAPIVTTSSTTFAERFKLVFIGIVLLLTGVLVGHSSVIFFIRRIKVKRAQH